MEQPWTTTSPDLLMALERGTGRPPRIQLEERLREAIRQGRLGPGARLPSSRSLAHDLGVSRGVVVEAYAQLVAEGYLEARGGSGTRVAAAAEVGLPASVASPLPLPLRYDFRPGVPDLSLFPRGAWLAALRQALRTAPDAVLHYGDPRGPLATRAALAAYLGRVRGVAADPGRIILTGGFTQALSLISRVLATQGVARVAVEDPSHPEPPAFFVRAGMAVTPIAVDEQGIKMEMPGWDGPGAVLVTPAHQFPSGVVLSAARRTALVAWARARSSWIIEDDYDAEYRYDRAPVGAVQGLAPERVVYTGTLSKMLVPALRIGWIVAPPALAEALTDAKYHEDQGVPSLDALAFAHFLESGRLDRHLRRARACYRARRDALEAALRYHLPGARVRGIAAGLHAVAELPEGSDEQAIAAAAANHGVGVYPMGVYRTLEGSHPPSLVLGYGALTEPAIAAGIARLAPLIVAANLPGSSWPDRLRAPV